MSEKRGPFDAAIRILNVGNEMLQEELPTEKRNTVMQEVHAAIRILEAARKVLKFSGTTTLWINSHREDIPPWKNLLRVRVEGLPEPGKEGK